MAVLSGKLYAIGGYNGLERLSTVEVFEPESKKWKRVSSISKPRRFEKIRFKREYYKKLNIIFE